MYFEDVRCLPSTKNTSKTIDTPNINILVTMKFNESTNWTNATLPKQLIEYGKTPPFGIRQLHDIGINGKGVNVAIIDQPLALHHPEYCKQIAAYKSFLPLDKECLSSYHGPAVTSLLVGNTIGVAPQAKVYYAAVPSWLRDAKYEVNALKWIMEINKTLGENKIKFVSVSASPGDPTVRDKHFELWNKTVKEANEQGICVVECTGLNRFVSPGYLKFQTDEFKLGFPDRMPITIVNNRIYVPTSLRTVAESYDDKKFSYAYCGKGGLSWGIPYAVGLLCLGQQVNNSLTANELKDLLLYTANNQIVNPKQFINAVTNTLIQ